MNLSQPTLARVANFIAFLGLVLEISGTFLGALHMLLLQRKVAYVTNITNNLAETKGDLKIVIKAIQRQEPASEQASLAQPRRSPPAQSRDTDAKGGFFSYAKNVTISGGVFNQMQMNHIVDSITEPDDLEERAMNIRNIMDGMDSYHQNLAPPLLIDKIHELVGKVLATKRGVNIILHHNTVLTIGQVKPAVRFMVTYGNIPSISMAGGVACLALSTILLAAGSQSDVLGPEVWIACLLTMMGVVTLSFLPTRSAFYLITDLAWIIDIYYYVQLLRLEVVGTQVWLVFCKAWSSRLNRFLRFCRVVTTSSQRDESLP